MKLSQLTAKLKILWVMATLITVCATSTSIQPSMKNTITNRNMAKKNYSYILSHPSRLHSPSQCMHVPHMCSYSSVGLTILDACTSIWYILLYWNLCLADCTLGDVRLTSGTADSGFEEQTNAGIVEICVTDTFGRVCNTGWANRDASVVCRELGFSPYGILL